MKTPTKEEMELAHNVRRFTEILELLDYQRSTMQYNLRNWLKKTFNSYFVHHQHLRKGLQKFFREADIPNLDDRAALLWDIFDAVDKADDARKVLAVIQAYNAGLIATSDNLDQPINEIGFDQLLNKKQEIEADVQGYGVL